MPLTPRQVAEQVRKMVAGEGVVFADLFAADGVLAYPFAPPGQPPELRGRDAIRDHFSGLGQSRELFVMEGVDAEIWETGDPDVVITQITHHGQSAVSGGPYTFTALGVIRVRRLGGQPGECADGDCPESLDAQWHRGEGGTGRWQLL